MDLNLDTALSRKKDKRGDKFEMMDKKFFAKVYRGYLDIAKKYKDIMRMVDGSGSVEKVSERVWGVVSKELEIKK